MTADLGDVAPALLWVADGDEARVNAAWLAFTGMTPEQAAGSGWLGAVHPDDRAHRLAVQHDAARRGDGFEVEYRLRHHDGEWRWVLERGVPLLAGYAGACFDITARRAVEQELLQSRDDLRLALAAGDMGTWVWDRRSGRVTRDRNLQLLYGLDPEASAGHFDDWVALVHPDDRERVVGEVQRAVAEGGSYELEHRVVRPDGEVRWLARRGAVYLDDDGGVAGTRGVVVDITDRKRGEEERNRLLAAEQDARRAAEQAAGRVARLQAVTAGLAEARTAEEVADVVVAQGVAALDARSGALFLLREGERMETVRHVGYDLDVMERYRSFSLEAPLPVSEALRTRQLVVLRSLEERDERYPQVRGMPSPNVSVALVPLLVGERRLGAITFGWGRQRVFDEADRGFLTTLGQQAAQALDRAQYYEAEHDRAQRHGFLAEASRVLGSSLDYVWALGEVASLAVPMVADACSVHLLESGALRTVVLVGSEAVDPAVARQLRQRPWCFSPAQLLDVTASGVPLLVTRVDEGHRREWAEDDAHLAALDRAATQSAMAVPLRSGDEPLGVVVFAMGGSGRRLGPYDVAFAEDLAGRITTAIANSRSHQDRTAIAHTLQASLLPPDVPVLPGLEVAARYRPVGRHVEVGGDFYDVFAAGGGRWGVVIGDVSGKGVPAATLTAMARYTVRTASRGDDPPSGVLEVLNASILDQGAGERFCTVALAFVRFDAAGAHFTLACGGQPSPLLVDSAGHIRPVGLPGSAIGLFDKPSLADVSSLLHPGETLVLYTDGVLEARGPTGEFADDGLLERALRDSAGRPAEAVADVIERSLLEFTAGHPRDDIAILVIRRPADLFHQHVEPGYRAVPRLRQRLREWLGLHLGGVPELAGDTLMLANELATNAERAARAAFDVHVQLTPDAVTIDVSDDGIGFGGEMPLAAPPEDAVTGRGLHIVSRLADQCIVRSSSCGTLIRAVKYRPSGSLAAPSS
ncbi:MAG TPA: SpoIIE family protein phosphatase [Acidimicrobiales bacterium]|nr:SpoIIE family protein phosphatase [Acidimicrobiales bacterium]